MSQNLSIEKISQSKSILILLPSLIFPDAVAAATGLYLTIKDNYPDKTIIIAMDKPLPHKYNKLFGYSDVTTNMGSKDLVISLNTNKDNIDKVSYDNKGDNFNLIIKMKDDLPPLSKSNINYSYRGVSADLIITIGVSEFAHLGGLAIQEPSLFSNRYVISFSLTPKINIGDQKIIDLHASSLSEIIAFFIKRNNLKISKEASTNLLAGIEAATDSFIDRTSDKTFDIASYCLKNGADRSIFNDQNQETDIKSNQIFGDNPLNYNQSIINSVPQFDQQSASIFNQNSVVNSTNIQ